MFGWPILIKEKKERDLLKKYLNNQTLYIEYKKN